MDDFLQRKRKAPEGDDFQEENREANKKRAKASKNKKSAEISGWSHLRQPPA